MTDLNRLNLADAVDHPVLPEPWTYSVVALSAEFDRNSQTGNALELALARGDALVRLRFRAVQELEIDAGFPYSYMGMEILDISHLQWDNIRVRVAGFEPSPGIRFWARSVERVANE